MNETVLLIDDDMAAFAHLYAIFLSEGYRFCQTAPGLDAIRTMLTDRPDVVILGLGGGESDWRFCKQLLMFLDSPLLLLLSTSNTRDRITGLDLGADDCMFKPVISEEVVARVRALLRRGRSHPRSQPTFFADEDLVVDLTRAEVKYKGQPILLTPTEFRLLSYFVAHAGCVLSHEQLARGVWVGEYSGTRDAVKQYVYRLRRKLGNATCQPERIMTRRGQGYVFFSSTEMRGCEMNSKGT